MANKVSVPFPQPLGLLQPGASFATVSTRLDVNLPATGPDGQNWTANQEIEVTALETNAKQIFIVVDLVGQAAGIQADTTNYTNVIAILDPGATWPRLKEWAYKWDLTKYYVSTQNATDAAMGCVSR